MALHNGKWSEYTVKPGRHSQSNVIYRQNEDRARVKPESEELNQRVKGS